MYRDVWSLPNLKIGWFALTHAKFILWNSEILYEYEVVFFFYSHYYGFKKLNM